MMWCDMIRCDVDVDVDMDVSVDVRLAHKYLMYDLDRSCTDMGAAAMTLQSNERVDSEQYLCAHSSVRIWAPVNVQVNVQMFMCVCICMLCVYVGIGARVYVYVCV